MIDRSEHIEWEMLNDFADGALDAPAAREVALHLEQCAECRGELTALQRTVNSIAAGATATVPTDLWTGISATIGATRGGEGLPLPGGTRSERRSYRFTMPTLAAAASLLIIASVSATLLINRGPAANTFENAEAVGNTPVLQLTATDVQFVPGVEALERQLQSQRASLQPATIAIIEKSLGTIDEALLEARVALLADPANAALKDVLETTYRQKMDFLTRAAKIAVGN